MSHTHDNHNEEHAHGHPVMGWKLQLGVLAALLFFTFATVLFYNAEKWAEVAFQIHLPGWVNIVGAMSIATVKAVLVCMFFMGLKYDKALNTFAMLFCLFCVALFLGFSMIDLESRDQIYDWKKGEITLGGNGKGLDSPAVDPRFDANPSPKINTGGVGIVQFRREEAIAAAGSEKDFWKKHYSHYGEHRHSADTNDYYSLLGYSHHEALPSANHALPRTGLTPGLFNAVDPKDLESHGDGHSGKADSDH